MLLRSLILKFKMKNNIADILETFIRYNNLAFPRMRTAGWSLYGCSHFMSQIRSMEFK